MRWNQGLITALLSLFVVNSTAKRQELDARLAEDRRQLERERREMDARKKGIKAERHRLTIQRVYHALQTELAAASCGQFTLVSLIGTDGVNRFAARITAVAAREITRDD